MADKISMIRPIGPEDIRRGQYLVVVSTVYQMVPWDRCGEPNAGEISPNRLVRRNTRPCPLRVIDVCLPYVLVRDPAGRHDVLDIHRHRVAQLRGRFGHAATSRLASNPAPKEENSPGA